MFENWDFEPSPYAYNFSEVNFKRPCDVAMKIKIGIVRVVFLEKRSQYKEYILCRIHMPKLIILREINCI